VGTYHPLYPCLHKMGEHVMLALKIISYTFAYVLLIGFFLFERFVRKGKETKNMSRTEFDKGSTTLISIAMGTAFIIVPFSPLLNYFNVADVVNIWSSVAGILIGVSGFAIRYLAFSTLGKFFTRTLRKTENHTLVTNGIYKHIRHPGYLSDILIFVGMSLTMGNLISIIAVPIMFFPAYIYRIYTEEKMLIDIFGNSYMEYQKTSMRLIPFIY
jgi:protein-S-isoprenylcysteine O-methyltransferase Ste14